MSSTGGKVRRYFPLGVFIVLSIAFLFTPLHEMKYMLGVDKFAHVGCAYAISDIMSRFIHIGTAKRCLIIFMAGVANEIGDKVWNNADFAFTMFGCVLQAGVEILSRKENCRSHSKY